MSAPLLIVAGVAVAAAAAFRGRKLRDVVDQVEPVVAEGVVQDQGAGESAGLTMDPSDVIVKVDSTPSDESITEKSLNTSPDAYSEYDPDIETLVVVTESPMGRNMTGESTPEVELGTDPVANGTTLAIIGERGATGEVWTILNAEWSGAGYDYLVSGLNNSDSSVWITSVELRDMIRRSQSNGIRFDIIAPATQFDPNTQEPYQEQETFSDNYLYQ